MQCRHCGAKVEENVTICHACGERVDVEEEEAAAEPAQQQAEAPAEDREQPAAAGPPAEEPSEASSDEPSPAVDKLRRSAARKKEAAKEDADEKGLLQDERGAYIWKGGYAIRDMNVIWFTTAAITVGLVVLGWWLWSSEAVPEWMRSFFWWVILGIPGALWVYRLCQAWHRSTYQYRLTPHRLFYRHGILVRREEALELVGVEDIGTTQSLVERLICGGVGRVKVRSADPSDPDFMLKGLVDFEDAFRKIDAARRRERKERGITIIGKGA
ncbi:MAG: zinc ribbon domain-containing protein [Planctomycetota bacterium]|jgi:membrane protein YdbS with pleckstrin-like domain